jgi:hypothetical protein
MKLNHILLFSLMVLLISSCLQPPELKPYVPKEKVKVIYVDKNLADPTDKATAKDYTGIKKTGADFQETELLKSKILKTGSPAASNVKESPSLEITDLYFEPDPLLVNIPFVIKYSFKPDIPGMGSDMIPVIFYFKIYRSSKLLFSSKRYTIKTENNMVKNRKQHMDAVSQKGEYIFKAFVEYKKISDNKSIILKIE